MPAGQNPAGFHDLPGECSQRYQEQNCKQCMQLPQYNLFGLRHSCRKHAPDRGQQADGQYGHDPECGGTQVRPETRGALCGRRTMIIY